jgi:hypothetical protein
MLKTLSRFSSSFAALLSNENTIIDVGGRLESIRYAMLDILMELDEHPQELAAATWSAVDRASEVQTLWYLRSDLLRVLSNNWGEEISRLRIDEITEMFRGIVHSNQMPGGKRISR